MKGSPIREMLLALILAIGLLIPMGKLATPTRSVEAEKPHGEAEQMDGVPAWVDLRFSHAASSVVLKQGDQILSSQEGEVLSISLETEVPRDGVELTLDVVWPVDAQGSPFAELTVEPDGFLEQTFSIWGQPGSQSQSWFVDPEASE